MGDLGDVEPYDRGALVDQFMNSPCAYASRRSGYEYPLVIAHFDHSLRSSARACAQGNKISSQSSRRDQLGKRRMRGVGPIRSRWSSRILSHRWIPSPPWVMSSPKSSGPTATGALRRLGDRGTGARRGRLPDPIKRLGSYPHQLAGGMRQWVMIGPASGSRSRHPDRRRTDHRPRCDRAGPAPGLGPVHIKLH